MYSYRCYCLDRTGHIEDVEFIECDDEDQVRERVGELLRQRVKFSSIEAWYRDRMIVRLPRI